MMIPITNLDEIKQNSDSYFVLVYKSESDQSECALRSIKSAAKNAGVDVYLADVNKTRDVHKPIEVSSAPTFVKVQKGKPIKHVKGCQSESFYQTLLENKEFTSFSSTGGSGQAVIMYTTPTCTYCNSLKAYLNEKKVHF